MKQSSVLLHSKVKKVLSRSSSITLSFHIHQLCTIWTRTNGANCITVHSPCIFLCEYVMKGCRSDSTQMMSALSFLTWERINVVQFLFGIRHFLTVHIGRATTKFPDMLSSAKKCAWLRGGVAKTAWFLLKSFIIAIFLCCVKLDYNMENQTLWCISAY